LSVEGPHASETLNGVTPVTLKFVGVVGLILSFHHQADAGLANVNASAKTAPFNHRLDPKPRDVTSMHLFVISDPFSFRAS
jgi:hypothetical protein